MVGILGNHERFHRQLTLQVVRGQGIESPAGVDIYPSAHSHGHGCGRYSRSSMSRRQPGNGDNEGECGALVVRVHFRQYIWRIK